MYFSAQTFSTVSLLVALIRLQHFPPPLPPHQFRLIKNHMVELHLHYLVLLYFVLVTSSAQGTFEHRATHFPIIE